MTLPHQLKQEALQCLEGEFLFLSKVFYMLIIFPEPFGPEMALE